MRIPDPAVRSLMQAVIGERDKLKALLNVLKAHTQVTVDRRPLATAFTAATGEQMEVLALSAKLTASERKALQKAVSSTYLEERGLLQGVAFHVAACKRGVSSINIRTFWGHPTFQQNRPIAAGHE